MVFNEKNIKKHYFPILNEKNIKSLYIICCLCSMKIEHHLLHMFNEIELQNFLSMEYNIFFTTECRPSMEIVVPRCSCQSPTAKTIERLHQGTTISIEGLHSVIIMFLFLIGPKLWGLHVISGILKGYKVF